MAICPFFRRHLRWLIVAIALLAFSLVYANMITFNFTVICIIRPEPVSNMSSIYSNTTAVGGVVDPKESFYYDYSVSQRNALFSAVSLGAILNSFFVPFLVQFWGARMIFTIYGTISALSCLLMPLAVQIGFVPTFLLRMVQGSSNPVQMVMMSHISEEWSPLKNIGSYLLVLSVQFQTGPLFTMPLSGMLCESQMGWPAIYYIQGLLTLFVFALFFLIYRSSPSEHPWISNNELRLIQADKSYTEVERKGRKWNVPYGPILRDPVMWIVFVTFVMDDLGFQIFIQYGPIYLNRVLGLDVRKTGFLGALPLLFAMITKFMAGPINDRLPWKEERIRINIFSILNVMGMVLCFFTLAILPTVPGMPEWLVQVVYISVNIFSGLDFLGVIKCSQHISQQFSSTIMAWESLISSGTILLLPLVVGLAAPNNSVDEWARILFGIAALQTISIVLFLIFCDSKPRPWTFVKPLNKVESSDGLVPISIKSFSKY